MTKPNPTPPRSARDEELVRGARVEHYKRENGIGAGSCVWCREPWPCRTIDMADRLESLSASRRELRIIDLLADELNFATGNWCGKDGSDTGRFGYYWTEYTDEGMCGDYESKDEAAYAALKTFQSDEIVEAITEIDAARADLAALTHKRDEGEL